MIDTNKGQHTATCTKCEWMRGTTSVKPVAEAWSEMHDCKKDKGQVYDQWGLKK